MEKRTILWMRVAGNVRKYQFDWKAHMALAAYTDPHSVLVLCVWPARFTQGAKEQGTVSSDLSFWGLSPDS